MKNKKVLVIVGIVVLLLCICCTVIYFVTRGTASAVGSTLDSVASVQSVQRDSDRRKVVNTLALELNVVYQDTGKYPDKITFQGNKIIISSTSSIQLTDITAQAKKTGEKGSAYCYKKISEGEIAVGVELEKGEWFSFGSRQKCEVENTLN